MRLTVIVLCLVLIAAGYQKGLVLKNQTLTNPTQLILLRNIQNKLVLSGAVGLKNIELKAKYSKTRSDSVNPNTFFIEPTGPILKFDTLKIFSNKKLIKKFAYKVETPKWPKMTFNGLTEGTFKADTLALRHTIRLENPTDDLRNCKWQIARFEIVMVYKGVMKTCAFTGPDLSEQVVGSLSKLKGGEFLIQYIVVKSSECGEAHLPSMIFKID
jgi:hypothetical protein